MAYTGKYVGKKSSSVKDKVDYMKLWGFGKMPGNEAGGRKLAITHGKRRSNVEYEELLRDCVRMHEKECLKDEEFDYTSVFAYSPEEGTTGAKMKGRPAHAVALKREKIVMDQAKALWQVKAKRMLGKTYTALVIAPGVARLESQAPDVDGVTYIDADDPALVGSFVNVTLVKRQGFDFLAEIV